MRLLISVVLILVLVSITYACLLPAEKTVRIIGKQRFCRFNQGKIPLILDENLVKGVVCDSNHDCFEYIEGLDDFDDVTYGFNPYVYCE